MKRKNKKGFTLIELLAIIVILAIIAVITVPLILNIINDAKQNASIDSAYGYKSALEKYYMKKVVENTENELPNGYKNISELPEDFIVSGESPSDGWVKLKKGIVDRFSLKYDEYVVTMDNDKNVTSEKQESIEPHIIGNYQEVEYLESTGTQYIDTRYKPNSNTKVDIRFMSLTNPEGAIPLFGGRTSAETKTFTVFYTTGGYLGRIDYGTYSSSNPTIKFTNNTIHTFIKDKEKNYLDGKYIKSNNSNDFSCDYTMYLNNVNSSGNSFSKLFNSRLYYTKIYDNGLIVRNFVPAIRKSDNKPGMLDLSNLSKNLFSSEWEQGFIESSNGVNSNASNSIRTKDFISVTPNKHYALNRNITTNYMNVRGYDKEKKYVGYGASVIDLIQGNTASNPMHANNGSCVISPKENVYYLKFNDTSNDLNTHYMMVEGDIQVEYEPYGYKFYTNDGTGEFIAGPEI